MESIFPIINKVSYGTKQITEKSTEYYFYDINYLRFDITISNSLFNKGEISFLSSLIESLDTDNIKTAMAIIKSKKIKHINID